MPHTTRTDGVPHLDDEQRRARLGRRHALARSARVATPEAVVEAMTVLHATEPATVFLSCWARGEAITHADLDRALYAERSLVKQLAMRRTLFVFPLDLLPAAWGSASARVHGAERRRMAKLMGEQRLDRARADVLALLADRPEGCTALEVRAAVPALDTETYSRVLTNLGLSAHVVRGHNTGHWRISRPRWTLMHHWLDHVEPARDERHGYAELVRRWLTTFGPGTLEDVQWWLGATKGAVRTALDDLGAVEVGLDGAGRGWVLPDDLDPVEPPEPWVALLPVLDPTVMGWKQRDFYLGPHGPALFDRNGNAGTTAWVDGRVVGCWVQDAAGVVEVRPLEPVEPWAADALLDEADRLTTWLDGQRVSTVYPSSAMRAPDAVTLRR